VVVVAGAVPDFEPRSSVAEVAVPVPEVLAELVRAGGRCSGRGGLGVTELAEVAGALAEVGVLRQSASQPCRSVRHSRAPRVAVEVESRLGALLPPCAHSAEPLAPVGGLFCRVWVRMAQRGTERLVLPGRAELSGRAELPWSSFVAERPMRSRRAAS